MRKIILIVMAVLFLVGCATTKKPLPGSSERQACFNEVMYHFQAYTEALTADPPNWIKVSGLPTVVDGSEWLFNRFEKCLKEKP